MSGGRRHLMSWKDDRLLVSNKLSGFSIVPDTKYPSMWRVRNPDGSLSDMVNRTRAKDAAQSMCERAMGADSVRFQD